MTRRRGTEQQEHYKNVRSAAAQEVPSSMADGTTAGSCCHRCLRRRDGPTTSKCRRRRRQSQQSPHDNDDRDDNDNDYPVVQEKKTKSIIIMSYCCRKMNNLSLLFIIIILAVVMSTACGQRIANGQEAKATDPGGNIAVRILSDIGSCTGMLANSEWIVTAGHCAVAFSAVGNNTLVSYTDSTGNLLSHNTSVAATFISPDYVDFDTLTTWQKWLYWKYAAHDFGMIRITTPLNATCEDSSGGCGKVNPDIPMNAMFVYHLASFGFLGVLWDLLTFGFWSRIFGFVGYFDRSSFYQFGYGRNQDQESAYRKAVLANTASGKSNGGQWWSSFFRDKWLFPDDERGCAGDSGSPWMFRGKGDNNNNNNIFAVTGVHSGGQVCTIPIGFAFSRRFDAAAADWVEGNVESTGGSCTRSDMDGDSVIQCTNPII